MMPDELSRYIQDFARPRTSPHWRKGSFYSQTATYGEFYWELYEGPWYDFNNDNKEVRIAFFLHGMHHLSIAYMLRTIFYHIGVEFTLVLLDRIKKNPYLWYELRDEMDDYDRDTLFLSCLERIYV
jgi:hypothetical protein